MRYLVTISALCLIGCQAAWAASQLDCELTGPQPSDAIHFRWDKIEPRIIPLRSTELPRYIRLKVVGPGLAEVALVDRETTEEITSSKVGIFEDGVQVGWRDYDGHAYTLSCGATQAPQLASEKALACRLMISGPGWRSESFFGWTYTDYSGKGVNFDACGGHYSTLVYGAYVAAPPASPTGLGFIFSRVPRTSGSDDVSFATTNSTNQAQFNLQWTPCPGVVADLTCDRVN